MKKLNLIFLLVLILLVLVSLPTLNYAQEQETSRFLDPAKPLYNEIESDEIVSEKETLDTLNEEEKKAYNQKLYTKELWKNVDYRNYDKNYDILYTYSNTYINNKYKLALAAYQAGISSMIKMREQEAVIRQENQSKLRLYERWYWQTLDRKNRDRRTISDLQLRAKARAVVYFTRAIKHLNDISNKEVRAKSSFQRLLSSVYRNWVLNQYDLKNLVQCIPVLELYLQIGENDKEYLAHQYLSQCYSFKERMLKKGNAGSEEQLNGIVIKKNRHFLRAMELRYGVDSPEYNNVMKMLNKDGAITEQN